jgi:hypothetical protein
VVAGAVDIGESQQGRDQRGVLGDRDPSPACRLPWYPDRFGLARRTRPFRVPEAAVPAGRLQPSRQKSQVPSDHANGAITKSPGGPSSPRRRRPSTTPTNSWPIDFPSGRGQVVIRCRSLPQMQDRTTRTTASVGCWITGSGTSMTRTSPAPYM